jgi:hypothetical protein
MKIFQRSERICKRFLQDVLGVTGVVYDTKAGIVHGLAVFVIQLGEAAGISAFAPFHQLIM